MSQTNTPISPPVAAAGPVPAPRGPRERKVRFGHLALAIALIVVGALGTAALVLTVSPEGTYLVAARNIDFGARFTEGDLTTVRLSHSPELRAISAGDIDRVVGNYATTALRAGTVLISDHVTGQEFAAGPGERLVGITLPGDRLPAQRIRTGTLVRLVDTTEQTTNSAEGEPPQRPRSWQATVVFVEEASASGPFGGGTNEDTTVDVLVNEAEADIIAQLAANDNISLTVLPGQAE
jgi:hypothetical protein